MAEQTTTAATATGYTAGEKLAGIVGLVLFLALAAIAADLATGGRLFGPRKAPCQGCGDQGSDDDGRS